MKLNCDMGESFGSWSKGRDAEVMPYIDMANIACGFHASDPLTMDRTVKLAVARGTAIGAHPGYPDLLGFGRRNMACSDDELSTMVIYQVAALDGICKSNNTRVSYVKPHGALYNSMMRDDQILVTLMSAIHAYDPALPLVVLANNRREEIAELGRQQGIRVWFEAFADRAYDDNGQLASRDLPGAVLSNPADIERQVMSIIEYGQVTTLGGQLMPLKADTICVHGDNDQAVAAVRHIRHAMTRE